VNRQFARAKYSSPLTTLRTGLFLALHFKAEFSISLSNAHRRRFNGKRFFCISWIVRYLEIVAAKRIGTLRSIRPYTEIAQMVAALQVRIVN
jgi:hypothetical protein